MARTIGIVSLKGGVGKTSTTVSLGAAMSEFNKNVLLVDADFSSPNLGFHLNILNPESTLHEVLKNLVSIKDSIYQVGNMHVIPSSLFSRGNIINPLKLKDKLKLIKDNYDYILVDSPPATDDNALAAMLSCDEVLFVLTPDYTSLGTTLKSIQVAKQRGVPISGLILNRVYDKNFELPIEKIEEISGVPVMAVIPHDVNIPKAQSEFVPSVLYKPNSNGSLEFKKLAATLMGEKYQPFSFFNLFVPVTPKRQDVNREIYYTRVFK